MQEDFGSSFDESSSSNEDNHPLTIESGLWNEERVKKTQIWSKKHYNKDVLKEKKSSFTVGSKKTVNRKRHVEVEKCESISRQLSVTSQRALELEESTRHIGTQLRGCHAGSLDGRALSLKTTELSLDSSDRFKAMMIALRECEELEKNPETPLSKLTSARQTLRKLAADVESRFADKYKSDIEKKPQSPHAQGHAAALKIIKTLEFAEDERRRALKSLHELMDELKKAIKDRKERGKPIDMGVVRLLENLVRLGLPSEVDSFLPGLIKEAKALELKGILQELGRPSEENRDSYREVQANICLKFGQCKSPEGSNAGASDSFFLKDHQGNPVFVFKPMEGEADQSKRGWEKGGAAPRELLASALNQKLAKLGLDCGLANATLVTLFDPSLANGKNNKSPKRTGAILEFAPNDGSMRKLLGMSDITTPEEELKDFCTDKEELLRRQQKINLVDVQKIAIFDFLTLNLDRSPSNLLMRKEGTEPNDTIRLIPIDGGNLLPCRNALEMGIEGAMMPTPKKPGEALGDTNGLMQLPQASEDFSIEMQKFIEELPDNLSDELMETYQQIGEQCPSMQGKVKVPEVFSTMKLSILFLKRACGMWADPRLTPADMAEMYAKELPAFLTRVLGSPDGLSGNVIFVPLSAKQIEIEMDRLINEQFKRREEKLRLAIVMQKIEELGGKGRLLDLGWKPASALEDLDEALKILQEDRDQPSELEGYRKLGGDDLLIGHYKFKPSKAMTAKQKKLTLQDFIDNDAYQKEGGDKELLALIKRFNEKLPVHQIQYKKQIEVRKQLSKEKQGEAPVQPGFPQFREVLAMEAIEKELKKPAREKLAALKNIRDYVEK